MALSIKDEEIDRKVRRLAALKQVSFTGAIRLAVDHELERAERMAAGPPLAERRDALRRIQNMFDKDAIDYSRTEDEILGYDEHGIPSQ